MSFRKAQVGWRSADWKSRMTTLIIRRAAAVPTSEPAQLATRAGFAVHNRKNKECSFETLEPRRPDLSLCTRRLDAPGSRRALPRNWVPTSSLAGAVLLRCVLQRGPASSVAFSFHSSVLRHHGLDFGRTRLELLRLDE